MKITEDVRKYAAEYHSRLKLCFQAIQQIVYNLSKLP